MREYFKILATKLSSRKLWVALLGIAAGMFMVFTKHPEAIPAMVEAVQTICGAVVSLTSLVTYIRTEGKIDAAALKDAVDKFTEAKEDLNEVGE